MFIFFLRAEKNNVNVSQKGRNVKVIHFSSIPTIKGKQSRQAGSSVRGLFQRHRRPGSRAHRPVLLKLHCSLLTQPVAILLLVSSEPGIPKENFVPLLTDEFNSVLFSDLLAVQTNLMIQTLCGITGGQYLLQAPHCSECSACLTSSEPKNESESKSLRNLRFRILIEWLRSSAHFITLAKLEVSVGLFLQILYGAGRFKKFCRIPLLKEYYYKFPIL